MQELMDKSLVTELKELLETKEPKTPTNINPQSIISNINKSLSAYINNINSAMGDGYAFGIKRTNKKTIKSSDFIKTLISEFFLKRPLSKDGKEIKSLSSGEQRLALMDLAYTFLRRNTAQTKEIILAIDEPEASLQDSICFEQFHRLFEIGENFGHQLIITTHWYGLLLTTANGYLHCVGQQNGQAPTIKTLEMNRVHEERRSFPNQVEMKSFFDLISSMLSILKNKEHNWIICEGSDDACYLKAHLDTAALNVTIIPVNGCANVIKIFKFLRVPFEDKKENEMIQGRVLCLIDSDIDLVKIGDYDSMQTNKKLDLWRWQLSENNEKVSLVSTKSNSTLQTEIEDCLNPKTYYRAILLAAGESPDLNELLTSFRENTHAKFSSASTRKLALLSICNNIAYKEAGELIERLQNKISSEDLKHNIAKKYLETITPEEKEVSWANGILNFFSGGR